MTDDQLISAAVGAIHRLEAGRTPSDPFCAPRVDSLERRRVEGATVLFESETSHSRIEITIHRETGDVHSATFALPPKHATPTI
jgi:hypothetical protein